jgi:primosomal protein N' (replication factor Y)
VRLVGVINADSALSIPDFRASERTFQLVSQVAGRTGRGTEPGIVIVQTINPQEPAIALAAAHDYPAFANTELRMRRQAGLPPTTRMARVVVRDPDPTKAAAHAEELGRLITQARAPGLRMMGPAPCPISRVAGQYRHGIELLAPSALLLQQVLGGLRGAGVLKSDARTAVDVDPVALM